jgi:hypothetical protein
MNRSCEIIDLFSLIQIPHDITKKILLIEKNIQLKESYNQWIVFEKLHATYCSTLFFGNVYRKFMLHDISFINGNFMKLQEHCRSFKSIKQNNNNDATFIMSFRF